MRLDFGGCSSPHFARDSSALIPKATDPPRACTTPKHSPLPIVRDRRFEAVNASDLAFFRGVLGDNGVVTDLTTLRGYNQDWMRMYHGHSQVALRPTTTEQACWGPCSGASCAGCCSIDPVLALITAADDRSCLLCLPAVVCIYRRCRGSSPTATRGVSPSCLRAATPASSARARGHLTWHRHRPAASRRSPHSRQHRNVDACDVL